MIGDLLASISGEQPLPSPTNGSRPSPIIPKRRAADEPLRDAPPAKTPRTESLSNAPSRTSGNSPKPSPRPTNGSTSSLNSKPSTTFQGTSRPASTAQRPTSQLRDGQKPSSSSASASKALPSRTLTNRTVNSDSAPKPEPKKGSFAEIMARANANKQQVGSLGKIQHQPIKKVLTMKERQQLKAQEAREARLAAKSNGRQQSSSGYTGTAAASRNGSARPGQRAGASSKGSTAKDKTPPAPEEKKVKKAALATTGYTGTARPRPGSTTNKPGASSRPGGERERERPRYGGPFSRPRRRTEEDDELDDFIDYDEEEDETGYGYGPRYNEYDSAEESDMEAGISDIDEEERKAQALAIAEDRREMALEARLKKEKEEKKRQALAAVRAKAATR